MPTLTRKTLAFIPPDPSQPGQQFDNVAAEGRYLLAVLRPLRLSVHVAEEIVQETFSREVKERHAKGTIGSPRAWRRKVAKRLGLAHLRKTSRRRELLGRSVDLDLVPAADDPPAGVELKERIEAVRAAVSRLPYHHRMVVELRMRGWTYRKIGELIGCSSKAIERNFQQALRILGRYLEAFR